jgi:CBS domain-containing protein
VVDEIANTALFAGLMLSVPYEYGDISKLMSFDDAKENFFAAARHGLNAQFRWVHGKSESATTIVLDHLLPLAAQGLKHAKVNSADIDRYLGIIEERVRSGQTGAQWITKSFQSMADQPREVRSRRIASEMLVRQQTGEPVHRWPVLDTQAPNEWRQSYQTVGQFMATDLFTVRPDDLVDLAASVMTWRHIRHVPVEDEEGRLVGLVSHRALLKLLSRGIAFNKSTVSVRDIMTANPLTVSSTTPTLEAIQIMRENGVGCLPVVDDGQLVGIVTSYDFLEASASLFKEQLTPQPEPPANRPEDKTKPPNVLKIRSAGS